MARKAEIQKMNKNPSKEEEITFLRAVAESIPANSYLSSFFSQKMVFKVEQNIRNDFCSSFDEMVEQIVNERMAMKNEAIEAQYKRDVEEMQKFTQMAEERAKEYEARAISAEKEFQRIARILEQIHHVTMGY